MLISRCVEIVTCYVAILSKRGFVILITTKCSLPNNLPIPYYNSNVDKSRLILPRLM